MAMIFKKDGEESKSRIEIFKNGILVLGLAAVIFGSLVYYKNKEKQLAEEQNVTIVGIHVKGAVNKSGYYEVPYSTRIKDLESIVGGFAEDADLDGVNLASYVKDGDEIYFPYKGSAARKSFDINTVSFGQLISITGIGEATARRIISYRNNNGKFKAVSELKSIVGESKYKEISEKFYVN